MAQHQPLGMLVSQRPLIPAIQESDKNNVYQHTSTDYAAGAVDTINIPRGVRAVLVQALDQNIRYTISGGASPTSGFRLTAGNDPIAIGVMGGETVITFSPEVAGARLEMQFCQ